MKIEVSGGSQNKWMLEVYGCSEWLREAVKIEVSGGSENKWMLEVYGGSEWQ